MDQGHDLAPHPDAARHPIRGFSDAGTVCGLLAGPGFLHHFDFVSVRILHKEKLCDHFPARGEGYDVLGLIAQGLDAFMLRV